MTMAIYANILDEICAKFPVKNPASVVKKTQVAPTPVAAAIAPTLAPAQAPKKTRRSPMSEDVAEWMKKNKTERSGPRPNS